MACPSYNINPNYTPGGNHPQYDYTDIASTAQFDPYAAPPPQPSQPQQSFAPAPTVIPLYHPTPYAYANPSTPQPPPAQSPEHHFIFDLPPELHSDVSSSTASAPTSTNHQQQQQQQRPQVHPPTETPMDTIAASQEQALREIHQQSSSRRRFEYQNQPPQEHDRQLATRTITVPASFNPTGSDAVHPLKREMKQRRHAGMALGGVSGALVGTLVLGPLGTVLGAPIGVYSANKLSKQGERRAQRKWEQRSVQDAAAHSPLVTNGTLT
jgi:hypothetical protein